MRGIGSASIGTMSRDGWASVTGPCFGALLVIVLLTTTAGAVCGDGVCDDECASCPTDCTGPECAGNDQCDAAVGENCVITPGECTCPDGYQCKPMRKRSLESGC